MSAKRIAYVLRRYPTLSETFVSSEIHTIARKYKPPLILSLLNDNILIHNNMNIGIPIYYFRYSSLKSIFRMIYECLKHPIWCFKIFCFSVKTSLLESKSAIQIIYLLPRIIAFASICSRSNVIHVHAHFSGLSALAAQFVSKLIGCNFSFMFHTLTELNESTIQWSIREASTVLVNSEVNQRALKEKYGDVVHEKVQVVRSGLGLYITADSFERRVYHFDIISVGRLVDKKGFDVLLEALKELKVKGIEPSCAIIGDGPQKARLNSIIKKYSLHKVLLFGSLPNSEVIKILSKSKIFVLPCRHIPFEEDGLPVAILEALACYVPVISCDVGGIGEVVINGKLGSW